MHVEVVGREVQPRGDPGREPPGGRQAERRRLDHEQLGAMVVERGHQRHLGVAGGDRGLTRRLQHGRDHHRHGRLAVRAGDGHQRPVVPAAGQVELADDRHAQLGRHREGRVVLRQAGGGDQLGRAAQQRAQGGLVGRADEGDAEAAGQGPLLLGGVVVGGPHGHAPPPQRRHDGSAHHPEAHDDDRRGLPRARSPADAGAISRPPRSRGSRRRRCRAPPPCTARR